MRKRPLLTGSLCLLLAAPGLLAQAPEAVRDAAGLQMQLDQLQVLGTVLYVAAHPDDENTALLASFARGRHLRSAYLSMTRGGGGQNLIGPEQGEALAALRTQELLAARRLDGAEQYFSRAVDFGFSKTPEETLSFWGHDAALADVVWIIRRLRPDVIITRFSPTGTGTHGHHTASARLALEAFTAAADPARFPEQLEGGRVRPWAARRILWNVFRPDFTQPPASAVMVDVGQYDPLLGKSYLELAAESRSMHRSQGFGAVAVRGSRLETFEPLAGAPAQADLLEGVDTGWGRLPGGARVGSLLAKARRAYRPDQPAGVLPLLLEAKAALETLGADPWVDRKRDELVEAIRCAAGLWVEAIADHQAVGPGGTLAVTATLVARGAAGLTLDALQGRPKGLPLKVNQPVSETFEVHVPAHAVPTQPYWMGKGPSEGQGPEAPPDLAGLPEAPARFQCAFRLSLGGASFELTVPVRYRFRDPVLGERYHPVAVLPSVMVNLAEPVQVFGTDEPREVALVAIAGRDGAAGALRLEAPVGWRLEPGLIPFNLAKAGDEVRLTARLTPPAGAQEGELRVSVAEGGATTPALGVVRVDYPHLPLQTFFPPASARLVRLDLRRAGRRIGYLMGAGDELPRSLRPLGYEVELLSDEFLAHGDLSGFDAILVGIRAFNTRPRLAQLKGRLLDYVAGGGTEVVQYSVDQGLVTPVLGPYPFKVTRTRVCEELAEVTFLAPGHPVLNWPNRISPEDFRGWVQERGLYFAQDWDARYQPVLSMHDTGEPAAGGSLLVGRHGKGCFVYTGLSFFRQLPAGVPGAYRLFANILALGQPQD